MSSGQESDGGPVANSSLAGYPHQRARTLVLAGGTERAAGQEELAAMHAAPMAPGQEPAG